MKKNIKEIFSKETYSCSPWYTRGFMIFTFCFIIFAVCFYAIENMNDFIFHWWT